MTEEEALERKRSAARERQARRRARVMTARGEADRAAAEVEGGPSGKNNNVNNDDLSSHKFPRPSSAKFGTLASIARMPTSDPATIASVIGRPETFVRKEQDAIASGLRGPRLFSIYMEAREKLQAKAARAAELALDKTIEAMEHGSAGVVGLFHGEPVWATQKPKAAELAQIMRAVAPAAVGVGDLRNDHAPAASVTFNLTPENIAAVALALRGGSVAPATTFVPPTIEVDANVVPRGSEADEADFS